MDAIEKMADFFDARVEEYDVHMLTEVGGCRESYELMARRIPKTCKTLLDLGCGTGLELDAIFRALPEVAVTGIDLTASMLQKLREKHPDQRMRLICGDYFKVDFGERQFDCAVSFQTMHHFAKEQKLRLYRKIFRALRENGLYIECDYMVQSQQEEDFFFAESARLRALSGDLTEAYYHIDTPCTVENQIALLKVAGFARVELLSRIENTTMVAAYRDLSL